MFKIRTKVKGYQGKLVTFYPNKYQRKKYNLVHCQGVRKIIELKPRKLGSTTGWVIDAMDEVAYQNRYYQAVTMAHTSDKSQEIFHDIAKLAWTHIPKEIRPKETYNTKAVIDLTESRGSKYIVTNDAKGSTPNRLHITEAAYFQKDETIVESLNALPEEALAIAESTAHGMGNWYEITFSEAWAAHQAGHKHSWYPLFQAWFEDPNNQTDPTEKELRYENEARMLQEKFHLTDPQIFWWDAKKQSNRDLVYQFYPSTPEEAFLHSGRPVFDQINLMMLKEKHAREPLRKKDGIEIWEEPTDDYYGIGVDTAEGLEHGDNSVISVVNRRTGNEVAQVAGKLPPHRLAEALDHVCQLYKNHLCIIERNNHGHAVIAHAKEYASIKLYRKKTIDKVTSQTSFVIGWDTNEKSKSYSISSLSRALEDGECTPASPQTYQELQYYVHGDRGIMGAMQGKHDDRVIALSLANMACEQVMNLGSTNSADYGIF